MVNKTKDIKAEEFNFLKEVGHIKTRVDKDGPQLTGAQAIDLIRAVIFRWVSEICTDEGKERETHILDDVLAFINDVRFSKFNEPRTQNPAITFKESKTYKRVTVLDEEEITL